LDSYCKAHSTETSIASSNNSRSWHTSVPILVAQGNWSIIVVILVRKKLDLLFQKIEMAIAVVQPCVSSELLWMRNDVPCKSLAHWDHSSHTLSRSTTTCLYDRAVSPLLQVILMKSMPSDCIMPKFMTLHRHYP
jgi:hypothetical protein